MPHKPQRVARLVKEIFDRTAAALGLIVLSPVLLAVAIGVRVTLGPLVLFRHRRPGLNTKPFELIKFRTMRSGAGDDAARLTRFGILLRSLSLDEMPQLWNVLKGDMSFVGPRPLQVVYLPRYSPEQSRRHEMKPGITGWAQVNGRNTLRWEDRFAHDVWYVDHWSLALDARILLRTLSVVLSRQGINEEGSPTMTEFLGDPSAKPRGTGSPRGAGATGNDRPSAPRRSA